MLRKAVKSVLELSLLHMKIILSKYASYSQSGREGIASIKSKKLGNKIVRNETRAEYMKKYH